MENLINNLSSKKRVNLCFEVLKAQNFVKVHLVRVELWGDGGGSCMNKKPSIKIVSLIEKSHFNHSTIKKAIEVSDLFNLEFHIVEGSILIQ